MRKPIIQYALEGRGESIESELETWAGDGTTPTYIMKDPRDSMIYYVSEEPFTLDEVKAQFSMCLSGDGTCPDCGEEIPEGTKPGEDCKICGYVFWPRR